MVFNSFFHLIDMNKFILLCLLFSLNSYATSNLMKAKSEVSVPTAEEIALAKSTKEIVVKCSEDIKESIKEKLLRKADLLGVKVAATPIKEGIRIQIIPEFLSEDSINTYLNNLLD